MSLKWTREELTNAVASSETYSAVCIKLNIASQGNNYKTVKKYATYWNLDTSHFSNRSSILALRHNKIENRYTVAEILCENSPIAHSTLRAWIKRNRYLDYKCSLCENVGTHRDLPLVLQLDHKNGIRNDNRLENLRWLCPNCHTQTITYAGRKNATKRCVNCEEPTTKTKYCSTMCRPKIEKKKRSTVRKIINWPTTEELHKLVLDSSYQKVGEMLNVSGNAVKKRLVKNGIIVPRYYTQSKY